MNEMVVGAIREPVAELRDVSKTFRVRVGGGRRATLHAVDHASITLRPGQTLGLVGESGSGKSTIARLLLRLVEPTGGTVILENQDITEAGGARLRELRRRMQLVFQDPFSCFDPLATIGGSIGEAVKVHDDLDRRASGRRVEELLEMVGLRATMAGRRPSEMSGGQLQRAAIARALAARPAVLALDEPVSSLDLSNQAQIINLLRGLQRELGLAYLFISHDLSVVRHVSHNIAVMYLGRIVESGPAKAVCSSPQHPYTQALLSAAPTLDDKSHARILLSGDIPSPLAPPEGCRFHTRCPYAMPRCRSEDPAWTPRPSSSVVACHLYTSADEASRVT